MESVRISAGFATHTGHHRAANEDSYLAAYPLYIVADGMGGHDAGDRASQAVVRAFHPLAGRGGVAVEDVRDAIRNAQAFVGAIAATTVRGAGSTLTGLVQIVQDGAPHWLVVNIGDSRVYRASARGLERLTVDHSLMQQELDNGNLHPDDASAYPYRNVITRAVGAAASPPDFGLHPVLPGERFLVCSDGLTNEVAETEIYELLASGQDCQLTADRLIERALENGGRDNVTVVVVGVTA